MAISDDSLNAMKRGIRRKLGASQEAEFRLAQLREGREVDLEDGMYNSTFFSAASQPEARIDDDFDAFRVQATMHHSLEVKITFLRALPRQIPTGDLSEEDAVHSAKKKRVSFGEAASALSHREPVSAPSGSAAPTTPLKSALVHHPTLDVQPPETPKPKRKKKKSKLSEVDEGGNVSTSRELAGEPSSAPEASGKRKQKGDLSQTPEHQVTVFTKTVGTPLGAKKKRKRSLGDEEESSPSSKPDNVSTAETSTNVTPKEPKVKKARMGKKGKESIASEVDQVGPKADTATEVPTPVMYLSHIPGC